MLKQLTHTQIWVHDQDEALAFYTEKLGMELREDVTVPERATSVGSASACPDSPTSRSPSWPCPARPCSRRRRAPRFRR